MAWWKQIAQARIAWIVTGVTAAHLGLTALLLTATIQPKLFPDTEILEIELAELPPLPEPLIEEVDLQRSSTSPEPEPETPRLPDPVPTAPIDPEPVPDPQPEPVVDLDVLTQLEPTEDSPIERSSAPSNALGSIDGENDTITPAQMASILKQVECQKLNHKRDPDCGPKDPFEVAIASVARQSKPPPGAPDSPFAPVSDRARLGYQTDASTFQSLQMSADLFMAPLAGGAYDAQRIRNGQEPLWSQEVQDGFRNEE